MNRPEMIAAVAAVLAVSCAGSLAWAAQPPPEPPKAADEGPSDPREILQGACASCHGVDFIVQHRKDRDDWDFTVRRMMDKGVELNPDDVAVLVDFLAKNYGPAPTH
jgi:cytochrome c5